MGAQPVRRRNGVEVTGCYLFNRKDWPELATMDPVSLATSVFFQMWLVRAHPYNALAEGDVVYIGDTVTRKLHWEVRISALLTGFDYRSTQHALSGLRQAYGLYAADLNRYHHERSGYGWLLAWAPTVMRKLDVPTPKGFKFGQNGYRSFGAAERSALGLPTPKKGAPLASPPAWYDPAAARTGTTRMVPRYIPFPVREAVMARDGHRCVGCGATTNLHLDHIHPWSHGGPSTVDNLRVVCAASNLAKGAGAGKKPLVCAA